MPNVHLEQELAIVGQQQSCVQAFTQVVKMWKQGCIGHRWCMGYKRRIGYYMVYKQVYIMEHKTVYKCCPGWTKKDDEPGCLHLLCSVGTCFNGRKCSEGGSLMCQCPEGFQGPRCQYDVNECTTENGGSQDQCCNTIGSYYCRCAAGQKLGEDGKSCEVMDPCTSGNGVCSHICQNERGFVMCECYPGYYLSADKKSCGDIDECAEEIAKCVHHCVYVCNPDFDLGTDGKQCYHGELKHRENMAQKSTLWEMNQMKPRLGIEMEIVNSCESNNGGCSHHCQHLTDCPDGLWGVDCQFFCEPCENGGECNKENGICDCPLGYTGKSCYLHKLSNCTNQYKDSQ
nr:EGF-like and EMI domain-containing protein 1 [Pelodiscus sinensis]|eukprot:XP_025044752.1 EGF-like and EMI domain-containing protein 1 [Pelodiscus sinensis]